MGITGKSSIYLVEPSYVCFEIMREKKAWELSFEQFSGVSKIFMYVNWNRNMIQGHCDDVYSSPHVESGKHKNLLRSRLNCTYTHTEIQIDNLFSVFVGY